MLLQPTNPLEKRVVKLVIKPKESRLFFAEMVGLKKPIEITILVRSIARSTGGKDYFDQFKLSNALALMARGEPSEQIKEFSKIAFSPLFIQKTQSSLACEEC